ncbi:MAG: CsgG/HfaB family protein [Deltaproteobacteria bacterium]
MRKPLLLLAALTFAAPSVARAATKPTVAILYFDYQGKDDQMGLLKKGLAQMLISDLSGSEAYQIVERDRLQEILDELKLGRSKSIDKKTAAKVGKLLGARYMVLGGYFDVMGMLRIDARVVEVETGKIIKSVGTNGAPDTVMDLEQKLVGELATVLDTQLEVKAAPKRRKKKKTTKRPKKLPMKTALTYAKALDAKDRGDKKTAKAELKKVVAAQPDFSLAQVDLTQLMQ